jgi:hypothetical protein
MKLALGMLSTLAMVAPLAGCSQGVSASAQESVERAAGSVGLAAAKVIEGVGSLDVASMSPEALVQRASWLLRWCTDQLEEVHDAKTAEAVGAAIEEVLDAADGLLEQAVAEMPNRGEVHMKIKDLRDRHMSNSSILLVLDPALARLNSLLE